MVDTVKTAGLVLVSDVSGTPLEDAGTTGLHNISLQHRVVLDKLDGTVKGNGVLVFNDSVDV